MYIGHLQKKCKIQTYKYVKPPQGTCSQFDNYGNEVGPADDNEDPFEDDDDYFGSPYEDNFVIGDLAILFEEEGDELEEIKRLNREERNLRY